MKIRHRMQRMLEDAGAVSHAHEVVELELGQPLLVTRRPACKGRARRSATLQTGLAKRFQIALRHRRPDHLTPRLPRGFLRALNQFRPLQILANRRRDARRLRKRHQHALPLREKLLRMMIRRRDHHASRAKHLRERA